MESAMKKHVTIFWTCLNIVLLSQTAFAVGVLFNRPVGTSGEFSQMWIKSVDVSVDIQDQIAVTHVDQIFHNDMNQTVEAIYIFPLPENAMITELIYWFNGKRYVAEIREREAAVRDYQRQVQRRIDPALLEYLGDNLFRLSIAPINGNSDVRTEITYAELLPYDFGRVKYTFLLNTLGLSPKELQTVTINANVRTQTPFRTFHSPSHENSTATHVQKVSDAHYALVFGDENFFPDRDFVLEFETIRSEVTFSVLTYTPVPEDSFGVDSFYALWITPPDSTSETEILPKDIVFTADVSSSMEGQRLQQLKSAMYEFLNRLNPQDRFNIITFGTVATAFKPDLVPASSDNLTGARDFIYQMYALGMTNIEEGLVRSLSQSYGEHTSNNLIFLTDGRPTYGETNPDRIVQRANELNTQNVRIFTFGIGDDISQPLLINLARENGGYPTFITADDSIALLVSNHFMRISKPIWTNLSIDFDGLNQWDFYPKAISDLFWGSQVQRLGLYTNGGTFPISLNGYIGNEEIHLSKDIKFNRNPGEGHRFVPRLWARAKINHLLEMISSFGETQELVDQVIDLSLRFQILTKYTALYSDPNMTPVNEKKKTHLPDQFVLEQNYPNPFNATTCIRYSIPSTANGARVVLTIYDALGRRIKTLVNTVQQAGSYAVVWDGRDQLGKPVASGVYFYTLNFGNQKLTRKMVMLQ